MNKIITIIFLSFFITACSNQIDSTTDMKTCQIDSDCILIQPDCSDCEFDSINKNYLNQFLENKKTYCNKNKPNIMCNSVFNGEIKCIENKCVLE